jgi:hypothetical protein
MSRTWWRIKTDPVLLAEHQAKKRERYAQRSGAEKDRDLAQQRRRRAGSPEAIEREKAYRKAYRQRVSTDPVLHAKVNADKRERYRRQTLEQIEADRERGRAKAKRRRQRISADPVRREKRNADARKRYRRLMESPEFVERVKRAGERWRRSHPDTYKAMLRRNNLKRWYGIMEEQYDALLKQQGGVCAICRELNHDGEKRLSVDQSHEDRRVRGLLCHRCNFAIGLLRDSGELCRRAALYIEGRLCAGGS